MCRREAPPCCEQEAIRIEICDMPKVPILGCLPFVICCDAAGGSLPGVPRRPPSMPQTLHDSSPVEILLLAIPPLKPPGDTTEVPSMYWMAHPAGKTSKRRASGGYCQRPCIPRVQPRRVRKYDLTPTLPSKAYRPALHFEGWRRPPRTRRKGQRLPFGQEAHNPKRPHSFLASLRPEQGRRQIGLGWEQCPKF